MASTDIQEAYWQLADRLAVLDGYRERVQEAMQPCPTATPIPRLPEMDAIECEVLGRLDVLREQQRRVMASFRIDHSCEGLRAFRPEAIALCFREDTESWGVGLGVGQPHA